MNGEVVKATDADLARLCDGARVSGEWHGVALHRGRLTAALGGVLKGQDSKWYGFINMPPWERSKAMYRHAVKFLKEMEELGIDEIFVTCDETIPRAKEFLQRLGFEPTETKLDQEVIWKWQH